jgi:hypothetical protein
MKATPIEIKAGFATRSEATTHGAQAVKNGTADRFIVGARYDGNTTPCLVTYKVTLYRLATNNTEGNRIK